MRIFVVLMLIAIIASLGSALVFIYRDQGPDKTRAVKALSFRVGLSFGLFLLLMAAHWLGWIVERL
ncbi:twin transmembrane helix small protein [Candidatus Accumulibacter contiguus]|jgi:RsiW-degrading membrane proteinase PrsW (M82 family)|uniref:Twin transmembrane helix small protein n=1 Tax=Candidatus Accumulibacter contiguus TaxID=2954381 RepID=A0ABX1TAW2_9PROT|nr:twin transmembrane helix small protein [Candidatus Accumulibacter contiguus]NMQ06141.1 twin transmembrane helix small protein [Candidatus Accumulibacter contiguus]